MLLIVVFVFLLTKTHIKNNNFFYIASNDLNEIGDVISSLSLDYKKWQLDSQEIIADFASAGQTNESRVDQLFAACFLGNNISMFIIGKAIKI